MILLPKSFREILTPYINTKTIYHHPDGYTLSFGESHCGYDIRVSGDGSVDRLAPGEFKLMVSYEHFKMPDNVIGLVLNKSTMARLGIEVSETNKDLDKMGVTAQSNTALEPGWEGYLTLEVKNYGARPVNFYVGMPIAQVVFLKLEDTAVPYNGKYQHQAQVPVGSI